MSAFAEIPTWASSPPTGTCSARSSGVATSRGRELLRRVELALVDALRSRPDRSGSGTVLQGLRSGSTSDDFDREAGVDGTRHAIEGDRHSREEAGLSLSERSTISVDQAQQLATVRARPFPVIEPGSYRSPPVPPDT
jgi:hypothetical protein